MKITLYVNDPPGKRCADNISHASELKLDHSFDLKIIKKTETKEQESLPIFPAIAINDEVVFENKGVSLEEFEEAIKKRLTMSERGFPKPFGSCNIKTND
jgi:hypothetical protein